MRMRGLLAALGLGRRDSSVVAHETATAATGGRRVFGGLELAKRVGGPGIGAGDEVVGGEDEEEEAGVFRASQEQQALVFLGKCVAKGSPGAAAGRGESSSGSIALHRIAYNNHRRRASGYTRGAWPTLADEGSIPHLLFPPRD